MTSWTDEMQMIFPAAREISAEAALDHRAGGRARAEKRPRQVHPEHRVPVLERHRGDGGVTLETGVVHEDVDASPRPLHLGKHRLDLGLLRDVGADRQGVHPVGLDLVHDLRRRLGLRDEVDRDGGAGGPERSGDPFADARIRASDERALPSERPMVHGWLLVVAFCPPLDTRACAGGSPVRARGRIPGPAGRVSIGGRRLAMAPQALVYLADSILYLSSILRDQPRQIDRYIDYFGGGAQDERAREEGR